MNAPSQSSTLPSHNASQHAASGSNRLAGANSVASKPNKIAHGKKKRPGSKPELRSHSSSVPPPIAPKPSAGYLEKAFEDSHKLPSPAELLIILDLNGTLLYRKKGKNAQGSVAPSIRPGLREFLAYLFSNFKVMIWTSARPENALRMVRATFKKTEEQQLLAIWGRDTLGLSNAQYNAKVQVYKTLERVWTGEFMICHPNQPDQIVFDQTNTVLFDDTTEKAMGHPFNLVNIPEFTATKKQTKGDVALRQCIEYLEVVKWQSNVSSYMREYPFVYAEPERAETGREGQLQKGATDGELLVDEEN
ncbi:HAD-like domain-containing protein [Sphaerosporella brunnea]|uniref:Mitochondrial import inner membrane translocase subunit TIM50 n=1 Tax=Sphaerosporella brunnea TaxID=1250544 RepID=A0A5J5ET88_9PEZI|nr:HAD-like domain-containing protein [Sphaerosporella brunnea]